MFVYEHKDVGKGGPPRHLPLSANGQPAVASYSRRDDREPFRPVRR